VHQVWAAGASSATLAAAFLLEPLVTLGPVGVAVLAMPEVMFAVVSVLAVVAVGRIVLAAVRRLRRRWRGPTPGAPPVPGVVVTTSVDST
jgi:hypothetical protein